MLPDAHEIKRPSNKPPPLAAGDYPSGQQYRLNILNRGLGKMGGFNWSQRVIILSVLVSTLATSIAFGFLASLVFVPKYFRLSGDLQRLAEVEKKIESFKASQDKFQEQTLAQSVRLNQQLREQGLKIESVEETAEAVRRSFEGRLEEKEREERERQLAEASASPPAQGGSSTEAFPEVIEPQETLPTPPPTGGPTGESPEPTGESWPTVPSLIDPRVGSEGPEQSSGLRSLFEGIYRAFWEIFSLPSQEKVDEG